MCTELFEAPGRGSDQLAHFGISLHMAEVEAEADAPTAHAVVEADCVVAGVSRQRAPVARVGPGSERQSRGSGPAAILRARAVSSTDRASTPWLTTSEKGDSAGYCAMRPYDGFSPTRPV